MQRRGQDLHFADNWPDFSVVMNEGVDGGMGEEEAEAFEALFATPEACEPVMNKGHAKGLGRRGNGIREMRGVGLD